MEVLTQTVQGNPFPGLRSFDTADAHLFFGRDRQIQDLQERLTRTRFLAIVGSSGSGKSSLVKAGLIPQLVAHNISSSHYERWRIVTFTPESTPIRNLALALYNSFIEHDRDFARQHTLDEVEEQLRTNPAVLATWCVRENLLVNIDQFEELFRYDQHGRTHRDAKVFIKLILGFSRAVEYPIYVVLTMRSDYLDQCTAYPGLTDAINSGSYLLPQMRDAEIWQAITTPVALMGASLSDELTQRLRQDLGREGQQLPVLQHALMRTWNYWQRNRRPDDLTIDLNDYEAIGTIQNAISQHAEEVYRSLPDEKSQLATEKLFRGLIVLGSGSTGRVHPLPVGRISEVVGVRADLLLDVLSYFRAPGVDFLTPPLAVATDNNLVVDIAHERILDLWARLRQWADEETAAAKFYLQLSQSAALYHEGKSGLWTNPDLQIGLKWLAENRPTQAWANRYDPYLERAVNFLEYSRKQHDFAMRSNEERQRRGLVRARRYALVLGGVSVISLLSLIVALVLRTQAQQSSTEAQREKQRALTERQRAEEQTREAVTQQKIAEQQEVITNQQRLMTEEQRQLAVGAQRTAEQQRQLALGAQRTAEQQRQEAETQRQAATEAQQQAETSRNRAVAAREQAQQAQQRAETQRRIATSAQRDAEAQRAKAVARTVAIEAVQLPDGTDPQVPALLALAAFNLNITNGGQLNNPDIFNALAKAANLQVVLRGHTDNVRAVAVSGGASPLLASGGDDGTVRLGPVAGASQPGQVLRAARKGTVGIRSLLFAPDGQHLYAGNEAGGLLVWNVSQPTATPAVVPAHGGAVHTLLWQPASQAAPGLLVSVSADGTVRSWRPRAGGGLDSVQYARAPAGMALYCARFTADGKRLVGGANKNRIISFDAKDLRARPAIFTRAGFGSRVTALAFSPTGNRLITGNSRGLVYAWQLAGSRPDTVGRLLSGRHTSTVSDLVFSPDGKLLASCSADWTIHLWDTATMLDQQPPVVLTDFGGWVMSICFTPDGKRLIGSSADRTVRIRTIDMPDMYNQVARQLTRQLTQEEWEQYVGKDIPYPEVKNSK
ncbi:hypothetical protein HHL22_04150 [Hymenobacter sp. RP-2-7]|uniref:Novel STAND NTPase 1 domain-containing protein n=1 Tax=Hymenobacter polaris TaxID=2682546 RepID=A0A7Y0ABL7_9BACT|nr:hypothetical protein [Hymenobacter polaris]NML64391.1 hypothetical protein [Hymenobacter polaris]